MRDEPMSRPLCRYCGAPIAKQTSTHYPNNPHWRPGPDSPRTWADCQQLTNERVVSVRYFGTGADRHVQRYTTWDGASYVSPYFCRDEHAKRFAHVVCDLPIESLEVFLFSGCARARNQSKTNGRTGRTVL